MCDINLLSDNLSSAQCDYTAVLTASHFCIQSWQKTVTWYSELQCTDHDISTYVG